MRVQLSPIPSKTRDSGVVQSGSKCSTSLFVADLRVTVVCVSIFRVPERMRRAPQIFTRIGSSPAVRVSTQLSRSVQQLDGRAAHRICLGSGEGSAFAGGNTRWSSSEAVSTESFETKISEASPLSHSADGEKCEPRSTGDVAAPGAASTAPSANAARVERKPLHSSAPPTLRNGTPAKLKPWEIGARRKQNPLAPSRFSPSNFLASSKPLGDSRFGANRDGTGWVAGQPGTIPRTTAEAIAMNREALQRQEASRVASGNGEDADAVDGQDLVGKPGRLETRNPDILAPSHARLTHDAPPTATGFDARIDAHRLNREWRSIIQVWEEIEAAENNGTRVALRPNNYTHVLHALASNRDHMVLMKCGQVYDHMKENNIPIKPQIYGLYMKACAVVGMGKRAVALMEDLDRTSDKQFRPTRMFMCDLLLATTKERLVEETKLFYGLMKAMGFTGNVKVQSAVLQLFLETGQVMEAIMVFEDTYKSGLSPKDPQANKLTYTCIRKGNPELVHKVLDMIQETGNIVANNTIQNVLYMASRKKDSDMTMKMWVLAQRWNHEFSDMDYNFTVSAFMHAGKDRMALATMIQAHKLGRTLSRKTLDVVAEKLAASNNRLDSAYYTLAELHESGEAVSTEAVNTIIAGSAIRLAVDRCFSTFDSLGSVFGAEPNVHSFNSMMRVLGGMRQQVDKKNAPLGAGMSILDKMDRAGVKPDMETYGRFVDLICGSGVLDEALIDTVENRMTKEYELQMDHEMMGMVACAFHDRGMYDIAKKWAQKTPNRKAYNGAEDGHLLDFETAERRGSGLRGGLAGHGMIRQAGRWIPGACDQYGNDGSAPRRWRSLSEGDEYDLGAEVTVAAETIVEDGSEEERERTPDA